MKRRGQMSRTAIRCLALLTIFPAGPVSAAEMFGLQIEAEAEESSYSRNLYNHWIDADNDGLDTRQEVLVFESVIVPTVNNEDRVAEGLWIGPY